MDSFRRIVRVIAAGSLGLVFGAAAWADATPAQAAATPAQAPAAQAPAPKPHSCPQATPCDQKPRNHQISVSLSNPLSCKDAYVAKHLNSGKGNVVHWCSTDTGWYVRIAFDDATGADPVYPSINCNGTTYSCSSGPMNKTTKNGTHSYHVFLKNSSTGEEKPAMDPGVIVND